MTRGRLYRWKKVLKDASDGAFPGHGRQVDMEEELRRLRRELEITRQERDMLKETVGIFATPKKRFAFVKSRQDRFPVQRLCQVMSVSTSGYYAWRKRHPSRRPVEDEALLAEIRQIHADAHESYGYRRVMRALLALRHRVGCDRVARLLRQNGIVAQRKRRRKSTTRVTRLPTSSSL